MLVLAQANGKLLNVMYRGVLTEVIRALEDLQLWRSVLFSGIGFIGCLEFFSFYY